VPEFVPDPTSDKYVYAQLAEYLSAEIAAGRLPIGARLLAEDEMVETYGVSLSTIRRALTVLRERGEVRTVPVKGSFVIGPHEPADDDGPAAS
jgi:GntR family transcriptional regulator